MTRRTALSMSTLALGLLLAATATVVVVLAVAASRQAQAAASDRLPDLGMLHPKGLEIVTVGGQKRLRFASIIVNVGAGPFELHGRDLDASTDPETMTTVEQRIFGAAGGSRDVPTPATMEFGGDGHDHWHVRDLQDFVLKRLDNGSKVGTFEKRGFCFFDNYLYGSDKAAFYKQKTGSCGGGASAAQTMMGLSVGWGDRYGKGLPDQYIDITGLTAGRYRLIGKADPSGWFVESDNTNNVSWVDIRIRSDNRVRITAYGPSDTTAPTVLSAAPTGRKVPRKANATATFSEAMNETTVEAPGTFTLKKKGSAKAIAASVTYDPNTRKATLNPTRQLRPGAAYMAKVTTAAKDSAGNALDQKPGVSGNQPKKWPFKVRN